MIRKTVIAASAGAVAVAGLAALGGGTAYAGKVTVTAGPGSSVSCSITGKAKISPALKDNWVKADHQDDANAAVRALPDTSFASNGPVSVSSKSSGTCTGTATDGTNSTSVTAAKISLVTSPTNPGGTDPATCANLVAPDEENPSTARYNVSIKWKAAPNKIADTTVTNAEISSAGGAFGVSGGTITGSFAGGTSNTSANPDGATIAAFLSSTAIQPKLVSSSNPSGGTPCQASLKAKAATDKKPATASLKAPKGVKKIGLASGSFTISR